MVGSVINKMLAKMRASSVNNTTREKESDAAVRACAARFMFTLLSLRIKAKTGCLLVLGLMTDSSAPVHAVSHNRGCVLIKEPRHRRQVEPRLNSIWESFAASTLPVQSVLFF